jgi:hypothetical protein
MDTVELDTGVEVVQNHMHRTGSVGELSISIHTLLHTDQVIEARRIFPFVFCKKLVQGQPFKVLGREILGKLVHS